VVERSEGEMRYCLFVDIGDGEMMQQHYLLLGNDYNVSTLMEYPRKLTFKQKNCVKRQGVFIPYVLRFIDEKIRLTFTHILNCLQRCSLSDDGISIKNAPVKKS
jgi:hypothetical protein